MKPRAPRESTRRPVEAEPRGVVASYSERRDRRPRAHEDDGPPVIGMGDHVPSFLLRPVVFKTAKLGED